MYINFVANFRNLCNIFYENHINIICMASFDWIWQNPISIITVAI